MGYTTVLFAGCAASVGWSWDNRIFWCWRWWNGWLQWHWREGGRLSLVGQRAFWFWHRLRSTGSGWRLCSCQFIAFASGVMTRELKRRAALLGPDLVLVSTIAA